MTKQATRTAQNASGVDYPVCQTHQLPPPQVLPRCDVLAGTESRNCDMCLNPVARQSPNIDMMQCTNVSASGELCSNPRSSLPYQRSKPLPLPPQTLYFSLSDCASHEPLLSRSDQVNTAHVDGDELLLHPSTATTDCAPKEQPDTRHDVRPRVQSDYLTGLRHQLDECTASIFDSGLCFSSLDEPSITAVPSINIAASELPSKLEGSLLPQPVAMPSKQSRSVSRDTREPAQQMLRKAKKPPPIVTSSHDAYRCISPPMLSPISAANSFQSHLLATNSGRSYHPSRKAPAAPSANMSSAQMSFFIWDDDEDRSDSDLQLQLSKMNAMMKKSLADLRLSSRTRPNVAGYPATSTLQRARDESKKGRASTDVREQSHSPPGLRVTTGFVQSTAKRVGSASSSSSSSSASSRTQSPSSSLLTSANMSGKRLDRASIAYESAHAATDEGGYTGRQSTALATSSNASRPSTASPTSSNSSRRISMTSSSSTSTTAAKISNRKRGFSKLAGWMAKIGKEDD